MTRLLAGFLLVLGLTSAASAQRMTDALRQADAGNWYVRVQTGGAAVAGRIVALDSSSVKVDRTLVPIADITALHRRLNEGGGWKIGAVTVGVAGALFGSALYSGLCETSCKSGEQLGAAVMLGGIGGLLGGVIAQAIHPPEHRWITLVAAPPAPARTERDQVLRLAFSRVFRRDSLLCAKEECSPVGVVLHDADSLALPLPFFRPLQRVRVAEADSLSRLLRTYVVKSVVVTGSTAVVEINYLFHHYRPSRPFGAPAPAAGALPPAEGGWHFSLVRDASGWRIQRTEEWIT